MSIYEVFGKVLKASYVLKLITVTNPGIVRLSIISIL